MDADEIKRWLASRKVVDAAGQPADLPPPPRVPPEVAFEAAPPDGTVWCSPCNGRGGFASGLKCRTCEGHGYHRLAEPATWVYTVARRSH